jgi:hypothetical protein
MMMAFAPGDDGLELVRIRELADHVTPSRPRRSLR